MTAGRRSFLTARDGEALRWVGEMYGVREDVLRVVLGRLREPGAGMQLGEDAEPGAPLSYRATRQVVARWEANGWADRRRLFGGRVWVIPTARGLQIGRPEGQAKPFEVWAPSAVTLAHTHAVALVRLHVEATVPGCDWVSERRLRRAQGEGSTARTADGEVTLTHPETGKPVRAAVEVELTIKNGNRYPGIVQATYAKAMWWFAPEHLTKRLLDQLTQAEAEKVPGGGRRLILVEPLPEVPGLTYETAL